MASSSSSALWECTLSLLIFLQYGAILIYPLVPRRYLSIRRMIFVCTSLHVIYQSALYTIRVQYSMNNNSADPPLQDSIAVLNGKVGAIQKDQASLQLSLTELRENLKKESLKKLISSLLNHEPGNEEPSKTGPSFRRSAQEPHFYDPPDEEIAPDVVTSEDVPEESADSEIVSGIDDSEPDAVTSEDVPEESADSEIVSGIDDSDSFAPPNPSNEDRGFFDGDGGVAESKVNGSETMEPIPTGGTALMVKTKHQHVVTVQVLTGSGVCISFAEILTCFRPESRPRIAIPTLRSSQSLDGSVSTRKEILCQPFRFRLERLSCCCLDGNARESYECIVVLHQPISIFVEDSYYVGVARPDSEMELYYKGVECLGVWQIRIV